MYGRGGWYRGGGRVIHEEKAFGYRVWFWPLGFGGWDLGLGFRIWHVRRP